jgi:hypothetical protein
MRRIPILVLSLMACATPVAAQQVTTRSWVANGVTWTETTTYEVIDEQPGGERIVGSGRDQAGRGIASFGPFAVIDATHAVLLAETDAASPADFQAMLRAFPGLRTLEMEDCPGTVDDSANLRLGRMIRANGIATHIPDHGSVRSGAVELFLAGVSRSAAPDAEFAVHSWLDEDGRQPADFAADDPVNRSYLAYYREMGLTADKAAQFYALTNSVPNDRVLILHPVDVAHYAALN